MTMFPAHSPGWLSNATTSRSERKHITTSRGVTVGGWIISSWVTEKGNDYGKIDGLVHETVVTPMQ